MALNMGGKAVIATEDRVLTQIIQHGVEIQRKVFAGTAVPPDLLAAYDAAGKAEASAPPTPAAPKRTAK